jgi:hypothetical protein
MYFMLVLDSRPIDTTVLDSIFSRHQHMHQVFSLVDLFTMNEKETKWRKKNVEIQEKRE